MITGDPFVAFHLPLRRGGGSTRLAAFRRAAQPFLHKTVDIKAGTLKIGVDIVI